MPARKVKGFGLLSGGLDSILAVRVLQEQDLDLIGLTFVTPFFGAEPGLAVGRITGIPVRVVDIGEKHLEMLKHPFYGYGSQMNPCIDCHALMLKEAGRIMEQEEGDFLFTGEVVGQRPMSQRRDALRSIEKLSGFSGRVLRPLSAKLLPATLVELEGLVDRGKLLDLHGRGRKRQRALAEHYGIRDYPQPGGGCMLTKEGFAIKLKNLLSRNPDADLRQVELLKWGRRFRLPGGSLYILGRHQEDNANLESLAGPKDSLFHLSDYPGPTGLMLLSDSLEAEEDFLWAGRIVAAYGDVPSDEPVEVKWRRGERSGVVTVKKESRRLFESYLIV